MSDEAAGNVTCDSGQPEPEAAAGGGEGRTSGSTAEASASAWREVLAGVDALGEALARWAKAAVNDPEHKRRAQELRRRLEEFASEVGETVAGAADSDVGRSVKDAAGKAGDAFRQAGQTLSAEVAPRLARVFESGADSLRRAADRLEARTTEAAEGVSGTRDSDADQAAPEPRGPQSEDA